jgi:hypothetical protein
MNVKKLLCLIIAAVSCASLLCFAVPSAGEEESTMKYMVIRLLADSIDPPHITISQGTVIIWVNEAHETAHIQFSNKDMATCLNGSPVAGGRTEQGIALSLEFGRTESICLVQKGEFSYTVKRGSNSTTGKITIK